MPVSGTYDWLEKSDQLKISIPLRGVSPSSVDIFVTSSALKVNYAPFLLDIVLKNKVDPIRHKAVVKDGVLIVTLYKTEPITWGEIEASAGIKDEVRTLGLQGHEELEKELQNKRRERKYEDERYSVKRQMALDQSYRERVEDLKAEEKKVAEDEVFAALETLSVPKTAVPLLSSEMASPQGRPPETASQPKKANIFDLSDLVIIDDDDEEEEEETEDKVRPSAAEVFVPELDEERTLPPPRSQHPANRVEIDFSPRIFPTPLRESKAAEEGDWIAKNRKHLKRHGVLAKHIPKGKIFNVSLRR